MRGGGFPSSRLLLLNSERGGESMVTTWSQHACLYLITYLLKITPMRGLNKDVFSIVNYQLMIHPVPSMALGSEYSSL